MSYLFTLSNCGTIRDTKGTIVGFLSDSSYITDFLIGVRAAYDSLGVKIDGSIIRDGDIMAWEACTVSREKARKAGVPASVVRRMTHEKGLTS